MRVVLLAAVALFMVGCSDDTRQSTQVAQKEAVVKEETQKVQSAVVAAKESVVTEVKATEVVQEAQKVAEVVAEVSIDAAALYQVCFGCHGVDGSKVALGKSQVIKGWSAKKIADALHGYKNGTYGGAMKGLMGAQASKLSDAQIEALAEYISKL